MDESEEPDSHRVATRTIRVEHLARVEGEGAMYVRVVGGALEQVELSIYEPPRFFETLLRGRGMAEAPDITARICGICPVAYQMSACHAIEDAIGVSVDGSLRELRRLIYCGEWIESHTLHVYMLHAPDFLGFPSAIAMAKESPTLRAIVERGLRLKKAGNAIVTLLGGREIHPINVRIGGFYRLPTPPELHALREELLRAREDALETVRWVATFDFPDFERDYTFVALHHPDEYAMNEGRLASTRGLDVAVSAFEQTFEEIHVAHSNALHCRIRDGGDYLVGPMARYALGHDRLSQLARDTAREVGLGPVCRNAFQSIIVRSLEVLYALDEAVRLIEAYAEPDAPHVEILPRAGTGFAATEAPRGTLYHRYRIDDAGDIEEAQIVPPTSQNQRIIESDLRDIVRENLSLDDDRLRARCEQGIRNHDPCISCATHFLDLTVERLS